MSMKNSIDPLKNVFASRRHFSPIDYADEIEARVKTILTSMSEYKRFCASAAGLHTACSTDEIMQMLDAAQKDCATAQYHSTDITQLISRILPVPVGGPELTIDGEEISVVLNRVDEIVNKIVKVALSCQDTLTKCYLAMKKADNNYKHNVNGSSAGLLSALHKAGDAIKPFYSARAVNKYVCMCSEIINTASDVLQVLAERHPEVAEKHQQDLKRVVTHIIGPINWLTDLACNIERFAAISVVCSNDEITVNPSESMELMDQAIKTIYDQIACIAPAIFDTVAQHNDIHDGITECMSNTESVTKILCDCLAVTNPA